MKEFHMVTGYSKHRAGWKKLIGGRRFYSYSGMDEEVWELVVKALVGRWSKIKATGGTWTEDIINEVYDAVGVSRSGRYAPQPAANHERLADQPSIGEAAGGWLHGSIDKYLQQLLLAVPKQISEDTYEKHEQHTSRLRKLLANLPLNLIGYDELVGIKNEVINHKKKDGQPLSPDSITTILSCIKVFFIYLEDSGKWVSPRGFERALKVDKSKLLAEADEDGADDEDDDLDPAEEMTFTPDELAYHGKIATPRGKLILGFGVLLGFTAKDIATLRKKMILLVGDEVFIRRKRQKTKHKQKYATCWWVPPELALLVKKEMLRTTDDPNVNPKGLAFLTSNKLPLVHRCNVGKKRKTDSVALVWRALNATAVNEGKSKKLSHKHLRKTGSRLMRYGTGEWQGGGLEICQQWLAHALKSVAEKNYNGTPKFDSLHAAQRALWREVGPLIVNSAHANSSKDGSEAAA